MNKKTLCTGILIGLKQCCGSRSVGFVFFWASQIHKYEVRIRNPDPSIIKKNSKKNIDSYCFVTFYDFLSLKNDVYVA